jgi:hypothetical protein
MSLLHSDERVFVNNCTAPLSVRSRFSAREAELAFAKQRLAHRYRYVNWM